MQVLPFSAARHYGFLSDLSSWASQSAVTADDISGLGALDGTKVALWLPHAE